MPDKDDARKALRRMQDVFRREVPGVVFRGREVRYNPAFGQYFGIAFVMLPARIPRDEMIGLYRDVMTKNMSDDERSVLAVLVGPQDTESDNE